MVYGELKDYYSILGVADTASYDEIKSKYRELVKKWHPDNCKESNAHEKFVEISEAYEILKTSETRSLYDRERAEYRSWINSSRSDHKDTKTYDTHRARKYDSDSWDELLRRQKEANRQAECYANMSVNEVLAYLKDRILYGQSALRGNLGFWRRSYIGLRALFLIIVLIICAVTVVGTPIAMYSFFALRNMLTYKGHYIGIVTLLSSALLAFVELILILIVCSFIPGL